MINIVKKKITSMLLAALVLLGAAGVAAAVPNQVHAAAPATAATIGVVDIRLLVNQHPDMAKANEIIKTEAEAAQKEFDGKAAGLGDKEKQELSVQLQQRVGQKQQELLKGIADKIDAVVKEVAKTKGLVVIIEKGTVVYGGLDITEDVMKKLR